MDKHLRALGTLFIAWAFVEAVAVWLIASPFGAYPFPYPKTLSLVVAVLTALYIATGLQLRRGDRAVRGFAILLSVVALFVVPLGTALGIYGLWVTSKVPSRRHAHA